VRYYHTTCSRPTAREKFEVLNRVHLNFKHGDTVGVVRCIVVNILDHIKVENDEHFNFILTNGRRTQYSERSIQIYILEDDGKFFCVFMPTV
jgi:hypothetical protein